MPKPRLRRRVSRTAQVCWGLALLAASTLAAVAAAPATSPRSANPAPTISASSADAPNPGALAIQLVEAELRSRAAASATSLLIELDASNLADQPACSDLEVGLAQHTRLRTRMSVPVRCLAPQRWQGFVQARLEMPGTYLVATRTINPGESLDAASVELQEGDLLTLPPGVVANLQELQGQVASRRIAAGQTLRNNAIRSALAVQRGQTVRLRVRGTSFVAMGEGQAMENANPGNTLQVRTASGQIVSGILQPDGIVDIGL